MSSFVIKVRGGSSNQPGVGLSLFRVCVRVCFVCVCVCVLCVGGVLQQSVYQVTQVGEPGMAVEKKNTR